MTFWSETTSNWLLVDDADGRVITEFPTPEAAMQALDAIERTDPPLDGLALVRFSQHDGAVLGTDSSVTIRSLM